MAYLAFYNKYRPQTFDEVVGQKTIVATLKNALKENKIAHAYLFCGPRGTGKTTMARLLAKALNCDEGIGPQCNECDSCKAIMRGDHPDVIEIDAASNSSVDSVRELIDNVAYQPIMSRYKVYIIDEVHNMSNAAFNALLKTLEEPPSFVVFILATTEPNKIIPTILSRVQRFDFSKVSTNDLIENMASILKKEGVDYDNDALDAIASLSDGGVRDSLSLLDKLVSFSGGKVTAKEVNSLFGLLSKKDEIEIVHLLEEKKADELIKKVREKYSQGMDIVRLHQDLITIHKDLILYKTTKDDSLLEKLDGQDCQLFNMDLATLHTNVRILLEAKRDYRTSDNALSHLELTLLEIILGPVAQKAITNQEPAIAKPAPEKKEEPERKLASKAVVIQGSGEGFEIKPKDDKIQDDEKIIYDIPEIVNLMKRAVSKEKVQERKDIALQWMELNNIIVPEQLSLAKALIGTKLRLIGDDILLVTSDIPMTQMLINKKSSQKTILAITNKAFQKTYHILVVTSNEFKDAYASYQKEASTESHEPNLDFGDKKIKETSTDFFNALTKDI